MSEAFFHDVQTLFHLLDLDGDNYVDRFEATAGLLISFENVHQIHDDEMSSSTTKQRMVQQQVGWLFTASHPTAPVHTNDSPTSQTSTSSPHPLASSSSSFHVETISLSQFIDCYSRLLQSAYEEEVLHIDLKRAIQSLQSSNQWKKSAELLQKFRQWYHLLSQLSTVELHTLNTGESGHQLPTQHQNILRLLSIAFAPFLPALSSAHAFSAPMHMDTAHGSIQKSDTANASPSSMSPPTSTGVSPRIIREGRRITQELMNSSSFSVSDLLSIVKHLLSIGVPSETLLHDLQQSIDAVDAIA